MPSRRCRSVLLYFVATAIYTTVYASFMSDNSSKINDFIHKDTDTLHVSSTGDDSLRHLLHKSNKTRSEYGGYTRLGSKSVTSLETHRLQSTTEMTAKNPHPFHFEINPTSVCSSNVFLLVYVHSAPQNFKKRMTIRETWGNAENCPDVVIKVVFLCGIAKTNNSGSIQEALLLEADSYGDIVQENFIDSYRNLTYKAIMGLKWASSYCRHAEFLLKSDDDVVVDIFHLVTYLRLILSHREKPVRKLLLCRVWKHMRVVRDRRSKWYLSVTEFPLEFFPAYCSGAAFVMTSDVAAAMFNASFRVPFFWVDDFYVTGLLAREVGISRQNFGSVFVLKQKHFVEKFIERNHSLPIVIGHAGPHIDRQRIAWNTVLAEQRQRKKT